MQSSRVERPEQLTLEVGGYSASVISIAVTLVFVLVVRTLFRSIPTTSTNTSVTAIEITLAL